MTTLKTLKSLRPDSKAIYFPAQIRQIDSNQVRIQMRREHHYYEGVYNVDDSLATYVNALPHEGVSMAKSGAKYVLCRVTLHTVAVPGYECPVRFQIGGPKVNRDWGLEFVLDSEHLAAIVTEALASLTPAPTEPTPALGIVPEPEIDEEDEDELGEDKDKS